MVRVIFGLVQCGFRLWVWFVCDFVRFMSSSQVKGTITYSTFPYARNEVDLVPLACEDGLMALESVRVFRFGLWFTLVFDSGSISVKNGFQLCVVSVGHKMRWHCTMHLHYPLILLPCSKMHGDCNAFCQQVAQCVTLDMRFVTISTHFITGGNNKLVAYSYIAYNPSQYTATGLR